MMPTPISNYTSFYLFQNIFTSALLRFSVPLFFIISGYLFFHKQFNYLDKLKKRAQSIILPYLIWSIIGAVFIYSIQLSPYLNEKINLTWQFSFIDFIKHITISPIQYQFWFLRDLIMFTFLSPIIYWLNRKATLPFIILLMLLWLVIGDYSFIIRIDSLLFFSIGASIANNKLKLEKFKLNKLNTIMVGVTWLFSSIFNGYAISYHLPSYSYMISYPIAILSGLIAIWSIYDHIYNIKQFNFLIRLRAIETTFLIYCMHEPILTIFEKIGMNIWGNSNIQMTFLYFLNPIIVIILCVYTHFILKQYSPKLLKLITGGR